MKHVYMLFAAIALEVTGTTFMKFSVMHEWLIGYPVMLAAMACSYFCLSKAVKKIPISVAYAVWTGIGAMGTFLLGVLVFGDGSTLYSWLGVIFIISGVILLKISHFGA